MKFIKAIFGMIFLLLFLAVFITSCAMAIPAVLCLCLLAMASTPSGPSAVQTI